MQSRTLIDANEALKILTWCTWSALDWGDHGTADLTRVRVFGQVQYVREECEALRDLVFAHGLDPEIPRPARRSAR
jgi:hypothetical protein